MAREKKPAPPPLPESSSDDEEEASGSSSDDEDQPLANSTSKPKPTGEESESDDGQPPADSTSSPKPKPTPDSSEAPTREESGSEESDDEEGSGDDEVEEDEDGDAPEPKQTPKPDPRPGSSATPATAAARSGSGSESEDESESGDSGPPKLVTPINSRPMPAANGEKANGKPLFQRIWTPEDEIAVLKGMIQFQAERGPVKPTVGGIDAFHAFIQKKLSIEAVTKSQLLNKVTRLRSRYLAAANRAKNGQPHKFQQPHDESIYELGKKVWEADDENEGRSGSKRTFPFLKMAAESVGTVFAEEKLARIEPAKADALENRLKKQKLAEMKHQTREMDLWKETLKLIVEGVERATD